MGKCKNCEAELRTIPAGISKKTGKSYDEFQVCDACGWTPKKETYQKPQGKFYPRQTEEIKGEYIREAQDRKNDNILLAGAMRDATLLTIAEIANLKWTNEEIKGAWLQWRNWLLAQRDERNFKEPF